MFGMREVEATVFATFPDHALHNCVYRCPLCTPEERMGFVIAYSEEVKMFTFYCGPYEVGDKIKIMVEEGI